MYSAPASMDSFCVLDMDVLSHCKSAFGKIDYVSCVSGVEFMQCRFCKFTSSSQETLLKHFRLHHGQGAHWPCIHTDFVCVFKTPGALRSHLSRSHSIVKIHKNSTFQCEHNIYLHIDTVFCGGCFYSCAKCVFMRDF